MLPLSSTLRLSVILLCAAPFLPAQEMEVHFLNVGQSDATLVIGPTGKTFLFDAGSNGDGSTTVVPYLQSLGISQLDIVGASHYHSDHVGGLDEVWNAGIRAAVAYDRGDSNHTGTQSFYDYRSAYSSVRSTVQPGQVVDLGGGALMTCVVVEGNLMNGQNVSLSGSSQWENSASIAWKVEYGDFDMWLGGDLTGGGNGTVDVETKAGIACGDVDVYQLNHHSSQTSSNASFLNSIKPEFGVIPCGHANSYGYPRQDVVDRITKPSRTIPVWSLTDGIGTQGYLDAGGHVVLKTDGNTYSASCPAGAAFTAWCDEQAPAGPQVGDVVLGELMRNPFQVADSYGEWLEVTCTDESSPVSLKNLKVQDNYGNTFTLATPILMEAGDPCLMAADGLPSRNGGIAPVVVWPNNTLSFSDSTGSVTLKSGSLTLEEVNWTSTFPGGSGVSAERVDLFGDTSPSNFFAATGAYGLGDKGSPAETNDADGTIWPGVDPWIDIIRYPTLGGQLEMNWYASGEAGYLFQGWLTLSTFPGINVGGTYLPANLDQAYSMTQGIPGWSGIVPSSETMPVSVAIPNNAAYRGLGIYAFFATYTNYLGQIGIRDYAVPLLMFLW
ncbi:MAG: MBL fold metallo-hydrolase [Planctomycetota bacterium]|nr:MBL fold metallo-hydrolase [Planctomycetota bacterium]